MKQLTFFFAILSMTFAQTSVGQNTSDALNAQFFQAYATASVPLWENGIAQLEKSDETDPLELAKTYYAAASIYMIREQEDKAADLLSKSEKILKKLLKADKKAAEPNALLSGVYGMQIALAPMKGMTLGMKSSNLLERALESAPDNPFVHLFKGNNLYYTPSMFGGDLAKSVEHFEKARQGFEAQDSKIYWAYLTTMAHLGQAHHKRKDLDKAKTVYDDVLAVSPNFGWVKYSLSPSLEKDLKARK